MIWGTYTIEWAKCTCIKSINGVLMKYLICEKCGGYYELQEGESADDFQSCECGGNLIQADTLPQGLSKKSKEIICDKCGTENVVGALFCKKCGVELLKKTEIPKNSEPVKKTGLYIIIGVICLICLSIVGLQIYNWYEWATFSNFTVENPDPTKWIEYRDDGGAYDFYVDVSEGSPAISAFSLEDYVARMGNDYPPDISIYVSSLGSGNLQDVVFDEREGVLGLVDVNKAKIFKDEETSWMNRDAYEFTYITTDPLGDSFSYDRYIFIEDNGGIYQFNLHIGQIKNQTQFNKFRNAMNPDFESVVKSFKRNNVPTT